MALKKHFLFWSIQCFFLSMVLVKTSNIYFSISNVKLKPINRFLIMTVVAKKNISFLKILKNQFRKGPSSLAGDKS